MARSLTLVVPVHNEAPSIAYFYERAKPVLEPTGLDWRILFVNDASTDESLDRILDLRKADPRIRVVTLTRNFGYHAALVAGLSNAESDLYAIVDVDCEDPPELLTQFLEKIDQGAYTAYGIRSQRDEPRHIIFFRWLFYWINRMIADGPVMLWMAEFAMMTRVVRDSILVNKTTFPFLRAELAYVGYEMAGVDYFRARRKHGTSHYNFFRMASFAIGGFLSSSTFPLRAALYLSGPFLALYVATVALTGGGLAHAAQWADIFTFAYLLLTIPMISVYIARTYKNLSARPVYYIDPRKSQLG